MGGKHKQTASGRIKGWGKNAIFHTTSIALLSPTATVKIRYDVARFVKSFGSLMRFRNIRSSPKTNPGVARDEETEGGKQIFEENTKYLRTVVQTRENRARSPPPVDPPLLYTV